MLITIIIAIVYGLLTTFLVNPWYIKGLIKGKTLLKNYDDYYNFPIQIRNTLYILSIICFSFIFLFTCTLYSSGYCIFIQFASIILIIAIPIIQIGYSYLIFDAENDITYYNEGILDYYLFNNDNQSRITILDNKSLKDSKNIFVNESLTLNVWNDNIRSIFKYEKIHPYGIIIADDNTVYKVFYIINTNGKFSNFVLKDITNNSDIIIL